MQTVVKIQQQNRDCGRCGAPCVVLTTSEHHHLSMKELTLWAKLIVCSALLINTISNIRASDQNRKEWNNYKQPPKVLLKEIYATYPHASLPSELSGKPVISSKNTRQSAFNVPNPYAPNPFAGWFPHPMTGPSNVPPYPAWPTPGPSHAPFLPSYPPTIYPNALPNPPAGESASGSPSDDNHNLEYPSVANFFKDLMTTEGDHHYFTNYTDAFHKQGYYRVYQLADKSLTAEHMTEIIGQLKEGTARIIKSRASEKVRQIRKGKAGK